MNQWEFSTGNCPRCTKIIFKDATFNSEASFSMRCPHCDETVRVIVKRRLEVTVVMAKADKEQSVSGLHKKKQHEFTQPEN